MSKIKLSNIGFNSNQDKILKLKNSYTGKKSEFKGVAILKKFKWSMK